MRYLKDITARNLTLNGTLTLLTNDGQNIVGLVDNAGLHFTDVPLEVSESGGTGVISRVGRNFIGVGTWSNDLVSAGCRLGSDGSINASGGLSVGGATSIGGLLAAHNIQLPLGYSVYWPTTGDGNATISTTQTDGATTRMEFKVGDDQNDYFVFKSGYWNGAKDVAVINYYGLTVNGLIGADRLEGNATADRVSLGSGNCRFDTTSGTLRLMTSAYGSADYGLKIGTDGGISLVSNNTQNAYITGAGAIHGTSKSAITETPNYGTLITYSDESPNHVFNDRGRGKLDDNGDCAVMMDPMFLETVNTTNSDYHVSLTGIKTANIYVDELQPEYFRVKGDPGKEFFWTVTVERYGYEGLRWNDADVSV